MRKFLSIVLFLVIALIPVLSLATDYTALSDEELLTELNRIRAEVTKRTINPDRVLCDSDGIVVSLHKDAFSTEEKYDGTQLNIKCMVVNNSDKRIGVSIDKVAINGWECTVLSMPDLDAGKKTIITVDIRDFTSKTDCSSVEDIEDIEFYCYTFDPVTYKIYTDNLRNKVIIK